MKFEIERGDVQNVAPANEKGAGSCQINDRQIMLHRDLTDIVEPGNHVMVAGTFRKKVFHALALKDLTQDKVRGIDCSNYVLLMGLGIMIFVMFGVMGMRELDANYLVKGFHQTVSFAGLAMTLFFIRYILRVNGAVKRVR